MHPSGSYIRSAIEDLRMLLNEATLDAKHDDTTICRTVLGQAFATVMSKAFQVSSESVFIRLLFTTVEDQEYYPLPPCIQQIVRIIQRDDAGNIVFDWIPRSDLNPSGPGWAIDGNTLRITPPPSGDDEYEIHYIPSGLANPHYSLNGGTASGTTDCTSFVLSATPTIGNLGRRESEYVGCILRVLDTNVHSERVISAYDPVTRTATLRNALPTLTGTANLQYEVIPAVTGPFLDAAVSMASFKIGIGRKITQAHATNILTQHRSDLKTLRDTLVSMSGRTPKAMQRDTVDASVWSWGPYAL